MLLRLRCSPAIHLLQLQLQPQQLLRQRRCLSAYLCVS
jgi:hypothetical protein